ncbi:hypothetical protein MJO28_008706 [Puccinia striiformis f. sp. tritici]|uniref:Uncharacterized protein n=1 Tax=Puccinia striiformis f. sp. tritici TaxID=168172 RepID=A0ACC0EEM0_9BASI|nr:hypothetical protein MJO28_008706 [Puccinia striiformis f. sp. tritici]
MAILSEGEHSDGELPTTAKDLKQARREERFKKALQDSLGYKPITDNWFHPTTSDSEESDDLIIQLDAERLIALIQYDFLSARYLRIITLTHRYLSYHHPLLFPNKNSVQASEKEISTKVKVGNNAESTKKLGIIFESILICFKKLWDGCPSLQFTTHPNINHTLLLEFLESSKDFSSLVPSLGIPAAYLFTKIDKPNEALKAIIPALIHSGSPRIRKIIEEAIMSSPDPKRSAQGLVEDVIELESKDDRVHLKTVLLHLGISSHSLDSAAAALAEPFSWSSYILLALSSIDQSRIKI